MIPLLEKNDAFLTGFQQLEPRFRAVSPPWMESLRRGAIARFSELGLPSTRQEEWRFTNLTPLAQVPFEPIGPEPGSVPAELLGRAADGVRIVLVDGRYAPDLSSTAGVPEGVTLESLAASIRTRPEIIETRLGRATVYRDHSLVALNTAFVEDGVFLHVPENVVVDEPIYLVHVWTASAAPRAAHPRNLIVLDRHAAATVVEVYRGQGDMANLTNAVTEAFLDENAVLEHYKLQQESFEAFHLAALGVRQMRDASFTSRYISLGGKLVRNEINVLLAGENGTCTLDGLYSAAGTQHMDCRTRIDHAKPHCASRELYKGILDDRAEGVFNGKIFVHPNAQKTDAKQTNQTLLLSDTAVINTKPQLEIFADDVRCTHGATVGQLDSESLFYLRSRGISEPEARKLLVYAFANEVVGRLTVPSVREEIEDLLMARGTRFQPAKNHGQDGRTTYPPGEGPEVEP